MMGKSSKNGRKPNREDGDVPTKKKSVDKIDTTVKEPGDEDEKNDKKCENIEKSTATGSTDYAIIKGLNPVKNFTCQICRSKFTSYKPFIEHFRDHGENGRKRFDQSTACDSCPMVFQSQTKAIQHKHRAHPNVPNSICQFCGKLFVLKHSLNNHLAKDHANLVQSTGSENQSTGSVNCDYCNAKFTNSIALQYHVKSMHEQINYLLANDLYIPPSSTKIIRSNSSEIFSAYYCHLCGIEYMIKNTLKKHLYQNHSPEERNTNPVDCIRCCTCEAIFHKKFAYERHLEFHKPNDLYAANQEERRKIVSRVDQDFDIQRVPLLQQINSVLKQIAENQIKSDVETPSPNINSIKLENPPCIASGIQNNEISNSGDESFSDPNNQKSNESYANVKIKMEIEETKPELNDETETSLEETFETSENQSFPQFIEAVGKLDQNVKLKPSEIGSELTKIKFEPVEIDCEPTEIESESNEIKLDQLPKLEPEIDPFAGPSTSPIIENKDDLKKNSPVADSSPKCNESANLTCISEVGKISVRKNLFLTTTEVQKEPENTLLKNNANESNEPNDKIKRNTNRILNRLEIKNEKLENKIVVKRKSGSTLEILDSANKIILLKKVVVKKKPKIEVTSSKKATI